MADGRKQVHANSLDIIVSNNQFHKDGLPIIEHVGSSGVGLPYAPENWPSPGDVWTWRVGKRYSANGFWLDRLVSAPNRLRSSTGNKLEFRSRVSLERYIKNTFPDVDVDAFFASFIWKIPQTNAAKEIANAYAPPEIIKSAPEIIKINGCSEVAVAVQPGDCKASNKMCSIKAKTGSSLTPATCNVCCSEPNFCRYCCCILCSKTIDWIYEGYNIIICEAPADKNYICGHVAHIECALRAYMAGKVGGSIDLDAQYYCGNCDNKTDLLLHVDKIIKVCESIDNRDDKVKVLNLGLCILLGSEKEKAKKLRSHIAMLMEKLKHEVSVDEICKRKGAISEPEQGNAECLDLAKSSVCMDPKTQRWCKTQAESREYKEKELQTTTKEFNQPSDQLYDQNFSIYFEQHLDANMDFLTAQDVEQPVLASEADTDTQQVTQNVETMIEPSRKLGKEKRFNPQDSCAIKRRKIRSQGPAYSKSTTDMDENIIEEFGEVYERLREAFYKTRDEIRDSHSERTALVEQVKRLTKIKENLSEENKNLNDKVKKLVEHENWDLRTHVEENRRLREEKYDPHFELYVCQSENKALKLEKDKHEKEFWMSINEKLLLQKHLDSLAKKHEEFVKKHNEDSAKFKREFEEYKAKCENKLFAATKSVQNMFASFLEANPNANYDWLGIHKENVNRQAYATLEEKRKVAEYEVQLDEELKTHGKLTIREPSHLHIEALIKSNLAGNIDGLDPVNTRNSDRLALVSAKTAETLLLADLDSPALDTSDMDPSTFTLNTLAFTLEDTPPTNQSEVIDIIEMANEERTTPHAPMEMIKDLSHAINGRTKKREENREAGRINESTLWKPPLWKKIT